MNGIDKIAGRIAEDARTEADSILASAKADVGAIENKYATLAKDEGEKVMADGQKRAAEIRRHIASAAEQEAKLAVLMTKQKMVSQAFDQTLKKLMALPEAEYVGLLAKLAAGASHAGEEEVILSAKDKGAIGKKVLESANQLLAKAGKKGNLKLSETNGSFEGGLLLKSGKVETNCTLDSILRLSKEELAPEIAATLFA